MENLHKMMALELNTYRLCHTRDLFVFSCFTGIGRADLANLKESDIKTNKDGSQWIHIARQKTDTDCVIPLLDIPRRIIEKYKGEGKDGHVFFVPTTTCICKTLKMIEKPLARCWDIPILRQLRYTQRSPCKNSVRICRS